MLNLLFIYKGFNNNLFIKNLLWLKLVINFNFFIKYFFKTLSDFFYLWNDISFNVFSKKLKTYNFSNKKYFRDSLIFQWNISMRHILRISYKKRNTFFVITDIDGKVLKTTTIRREGFFGRRRKEYLSMLITVKEVKKLIDFFGIEHLDIIFNGLGRFRFVISKVFKGDRKVWLFRMKTKVKPLTPHNGCKLSKAKNRKRLRWKRFFKKK